MVRTFYASQVLAYCILSEGQALSTPANILGGISMQLFRISIKFEQDGKWSNRDADLEGYLVKKSEAYDTVEGYVNVLYPTYSEPVRYIKGLYASDDSLIFVQMVNDDHLTPICYCFPATDQQGYWSSYNTAVGFFPVSPGTPCSLGRATLRIEEVTEQSELMKKTLATFGRKSLEANFINQCMLEDYRNLADVLEPGVVFQMKLHCGKW